MRVRVNSAPGVSARTVLWSDSDPFRWHGAARIDGRRGAELGVVTVFGTSSAWDSILTWRAGGLVLEMVPGNSSVGGRWGVDSAVLTSAGWTRKLVHGEARMIQRVAAADPRHPHRKWSGTREVFAFRHGAWVTVAQRRQKWTEKQARAFAGWHVPGLPRWS